MFVRPRCGGDSFDPQARDGQSAALMEKLQPAFRCSKRAAFDNDLNCVSVNNQQHPSSHQRLPARAHESTKRLFERVHDERASKTTCKCNRYTDICDL
eukprot:4762763-Amphidinium_carterae.1